MSSIRATLWVICITGILCGSCVRGVFQPVNVGREYGDKVPLAVGHLGGYGKASKTGWHWFGQDVICFDYACRLKYSKKRAMRAISFDNFKKRIKKNAKKGEYKRFNVTPLPAKPKPKQDTMKIPVDTVIAAPVQLPITVAEPIQQVLQHDSLITLTDLLFELNSAKLKNEHFAQLDSLAKWLTLRPLIEVSVYGHTDSTGTERHNVGLSTRRAGSVADYLARQGVSEDRILFEGFGSAKPIERNATEKGRSRNRRVEILLRNSKK